jgi:hypothetical protein
LVGVNTDALGQAAAANTASNNRGVKINSRFILAGSMRVANLPQVFAARIAAACL